MEFRANTTIAASAQDVWDVLVDTNRWSEWDPHVERIDGEVILGEKVTVHTTLSSSAFPVEVAEFAPPHRMLWRGGLPFGLMTGNRTFTLSEADGVTTYDVHEVFTGPLLGIMKRFMPDLQPSFEAHVAGLRAHIED